MKYLTLTFLLFVGIKTLGQNETKFNSFSLPRYSEFSIAFQNSPTCSFAGTTESCKISEVMMVTGKNKCFEWNKPLWSRVLLGACLMGITGAIAHAAEPDKFAWDFATFTLLMTGTGALMGVGAYLMALGYL